MCIIDFVVDVEEFTFIINGVPKTSYRCSRKLFSRALNLALFYMTCVREYSGPP